MIFGDKAIIHEIKNNTLVILTGISAI